VSCASFSQIQNNKLRCATGSYDRYINLYEIDNIRNVNFDPKKHVQLYAKLKHKFRILGLDWCIHNYDRLLNTCDKHATVQVWNAAREEVPERRIANIRGHRGFMVSAIFSTDNPDIVLTASDDQTVKGWDLNNIKNIKPPNKKRPKTRKKKGTGSDSEDNDTESYSNTETTLTRDRGPFSAIKERMSKIDEDNISAIAEDEERFQEPELKVIQESKTDGKVGAGNKIHEMTLTGEGQKIRKAQDDFEDPGKYVSATPDQEITKQLFMGDDGDAGDGDMGQEDMFSGPKGTSSGDPKLDELSEKLAELRGKQENLQLKEGLMKDSGMDLEPLAKDNEME